MKKVLITGTAGFIGHYLAILLKEAGYKVVGLDHINDYYDIDLKYHRLKLQGVEVDSIEYGEILRSDIDFIKLNLEDGDALKALFKEEQFDYVINLAAQPGVRYSLENPKAYIDCNIIGFLNILEACRAYPVEHLIFASTSSVYGMNKEIPFKTTDNTDHPISLYAATKKSNEMMAHTYAHLFGIPSTGLRFFTVYGPLGRPDMAMFLFTDAVANDRPIKVFGNGDMSRDFTYVEDIAKAIELLIPHIPHASEMKDVNPASNESYAPYRLFNIGHNSPVQLMDFIREVEKNFNKEAQKNYMDMQPGDVRQTYADVSELYDMIDYKPETSVETGVKKFIDWYKEYYDIE